MATHSSIFAWRIPGTGEPIGLPSMGSHRVGHNWSDLAATIPEKVMAPHSSTLAWKIPWMEKPGRLQSMGSEESETTERLHFHFSVPCIGEGNGNPLQCSCLENPREGEPGGLPSMGSHRVRHNWSDLAAAAAAVYTCQLYSPNSSRLPLLYPRVHMSVLYICLCIPALLKSSSVPFFLDSTYMH